MDRLLGKKLDEGVRAGVFPCGVVAHRRGGTLSVAARGRLEYPAPGASSPAAGAGTVFDLASLTKIVSTLPLALLSIQSGRVGLDAEASRYLPELAAGRGGSWNGSITVRRLLAHTSGLPAWRPYGVLLKGKNEYLSAIADEEPSYAPGSRVEYSDLGFMLLGWIVERAWDEELPALADRLVFGPLGMERTGYLPLALPRLSGAEYAPTETGNAYERGMALAYAEGRPVVGGRGSSFVLEPADIERLPWRRAPVLGEVHDGNCHYGLGGVSGHAGLFSTADDLVRYMDFWATRGPLSPELRAEAFRRQTPEGQTERGLGWILDADGSAMHTGFTGTALRYWPATGDATVALTNRVHPRVADGIGPWRLALAAAISGAGA